MPKRHATRTQYAEAARYANAVDKYLLPIIAAVIVISLIPSILHIVKENRDIKIKK
jgi:hypothetical protein